MALPQPALAEQWRQLLHSQPTRNQLAVAAVLLGRAEPQMATFVVEMDSSLPSPLLEQLLVRMEHFELVPELDFFRLLL